MNQYTNPYMNPYGLQLQNYQQYPVSPVMQVTKVNGEPGARSFQIGPNSSAWLLDESGLISWLITTDGAGYKTVTAYDVLPHKQTPTQDWNTLDQRITKLEAMINAADTADTPTTRKKSAGNKSDDGSN